MITNDLVEYIKGELEKNISKDLIISSLFEAGWHKEDIDEGFLSVEKVENKIQEPLDPYREPPEGGDPLSMKIEPKETPSIISFTKIEAPVIDRPVVNTPILDKTAEPVKVWVPSTIKPKIEELKENTKGLESYNLELPGEKVDIIPVQKVAPIEANSVSFVKNSSFDMRPPTSQDSFMPVINKSPVSNNTPVKTMSDIVTKSAMISSYSQDIIAAANKEEVEIVASRKKRSLLKLGILAVVLILIGIMIFSFIAGYIKIPGTNSSIFVVKKDPKTTLLNSASDIALLKSYKTQTSINISSPSLSSITTGLSSGNVVNSKDRDSVSVNIKGSTNQTADQSISDYALSFQSSLIKNSINADIKYNGTDLYLATPDLSQVLGSDFPKPTTVLTTRDQLGLIVGEMPSSVQTFMKKADVYDILSKGVPVYVENEIGPMFKDFITSFDYVDKGSDTIHNVETNHYEVITTRDSKKKLLSSLTDLFVPQLNSSDKDSLDGILGSSSISSFEVWIGKNDDHLYQIKFTLNAPLSKILNLNDSGIAGNEVNLDWITTFYDLNVANNISIPKAETNMDGFIKSIQNIKIKNIVSSFKPQATVFKNAVGSYGNKSNLSGSCATPDAGSMFSPAGHSKGADTAVSSISSTMNSLLLITKGEGYCYSSSSAWAMAAPLTTTPASYYCTDSKGNINIIASPIIGTSCSLVKPITP